MGKANRPSKTRRGSADPILLAQLSRAVEEKHGADAIRILARLEPDTFDPPALELAAKALFMRALQGYASGAHINAAIADLSLASRYQPANPQIWFHLGLAFLKAGLYSKGMWSLRKAVELRPGSSRYTYHAAWAGLASQSQEAPKWISRLDTSARETRFLKACSELLAGWNSPDAAHSRDGFMESVAAGNGSTQPLPAAIGTLSLGSGELGAGPGDSEQGAGSEFLLLRALAAAVTQPDADLRPGASHLREAALADPDNPVIQLALGNLELQQRNPGRALECLEAAVRGGIRTPELTQCLARLHLRRAVQEFDGGNQDSARLSLERAGTLAPDLEPWIRQCKQPSMASKALRLAQQGDLAAAVLLWREMEKSSTAYLPVLHNLALAYERLQDWEKAASYWQRWIRACSSHGSALRDQVFASEAWRKLGNCLLQAGRGPEAAAAFRSVLAAAPEDAEARESLAHLSMEAENWDEAIRHMEFLQQNQKESSTRWTQLGMARLMKDDLEGATQAWNRAVELEPGNEAAQSYLVEALESRLSAMSPKEYAMKGLPLIQKMIERLPKHFAPHLVLAKYFFTFNDRKRGKDSVERALQTELQNPEAWTGALKIFLEYGTRADCDRLGERILKSFGHHPAAQGAAGSLFLSHGLEKQAAKHFRAAMENCTRALIPLQIARAYVGQGYTEEGERHARLALELDARNAEAHALLATILFMDGKRQLATEQLRIARSLAEETGDSELLITLEELEDMSVLARQLSVLFRR